MNETNDTGEKFAAVPARHVAAVVVGNALEFYDFLTYAFFAVYIGRAFFPSSSPTASLLESLGAFGAGFVTRPIGGYVIGTMGDRVGRKPAMILSFSLMGVAIVGLALTPSHSMIGVAAPILVVCFRMLQGFALGGNVGPTTAFLMEAAPPERRGFYTAFQSWTQDLSVLAAGLVGFVLAEVLSDRQLETFGWRVAFLLGATIVPFGLMLRRSLPETLYAAEDAKRERVALRPYISVAILGGLLLASGTIGTYVASYMTTYAISTLHMHANVAFAATVVIGVAGAIFDLPSGILSDHIGRKLTMIIPGVALLLLIFPAFYVLDHHRTPAVLLGVTGVLYSLFALSTCPFVIWLAESLPAQIRSGGVATVYAVAIAIFGGTTQYAVTWLIKATGNPEAPAWYWAAAALMGLAVMLGIHESAPRKLARRSAENTARR
jgi:MHS family citrate/tricarballylate:H+ symporter-like MFS transporter